MVDVTIVTITRHNKTHHPTAQHISKEGLPPPPPPPLLSFSSSLLLMMMIDDR